MAVYQIEKGELVEVGATLEELLREDWADWEDYEELLKKLKLSLYDEVSDVYKMYRRPDGAQNSPLGELPGIKYVFDVNIDGDNFDYILLSDRLPEYLAVMRLLEPLVNRDQLLRQEVKEHLTQKKRT
jgi:HPt (histidine-containing phosphotransfer) domain-containing protein